MKLTVNRDILISNLSIAQDIVSTKTTMTIFSNVLISINTNILTIRATDSKLSFEKTFRLEADNNEDGSICLYCDRLVNATRTMPKGEVIIEEIGDSSVRIRSAVNNDLEYIMFTTNIDNYPSFSAAPQEGHFDLPQRELKEMINQTIFAVSRDETRYYLSGVYMGIDNNVLVLVASDGRRLSLSKYDGDCSSFNIEKGIIIPIKILSLVQKYSSGEGIIGILIHNEQIFFKIDDIYLSSLLVKGEFPNFQRVIPESQQYNLRAQRDLLIESVSNVAIFVEKSKRIYLLIGKENIEIKSDKSEIGQAKGIVPCKMEGQDTTIALNYLYLLEPLRALSDKEVIIGFTENSRAISIYAANNDRNIHIAMPMQID